MDEPLAGVDVDSQASLAELLGSLRDSGVGMGLVLHEIEAMAPVLDRHVRLSDGRVVNPTGASVGKRELATRAHEPGGDR